MLLVKMFRWFPIIPRLQWLFMTPIMSKLMLWNSQNSSLDGLMKHPCDPKAWKHIHQKFLDFATNPWNAHLTFVANGVNPFKLTWSTWSTCLVMLLNYNFPLWLTSKFFFHHVRIIESRERICHIKTLWCLSTTISWRAITNLDRSSNIWCAKTL